MSMQESIKSLLYSGDYSDLKITCNGQEWKVHKAIVCSQSKFLDAAVKFGGTETNQGVIDLPDDDPVVVGYMIDYLYSSTYTLPSENEKVCWFRMDWGTWNGVQVGAEHGVLDAKTKREVDYMLWCVSNKMKDKVIADFPDLDVELEYSVILLDGRKERDRQIYRTLHDAKAQWKEHPEDFPLPVSHEDAMIHARLYTLADKYDIYPLKMMANCNLWDYLDDRFPDAGFFDVVYEVFTTTPETDVHLREAVAGYIDRSRKKYGMFEGLEDNLREIPDLAYHVAKWAWRDLEP